ncbi:glycosyltransferase involved in cell wall biosynthesis [Angulomicrobium tetraedrale]|uniref:Glycosyltransferase involved in cell wall biosynthesis n=1 Tax=Ancylobacter tetraedralis TaxID=217068 RepID=A0A839Z931_9HYPH|nr:glycosyltransferase family 2 protein [Ancylobacter tetraedralis]MBB3771005.1 glycosyltransferase involved in cell wall biosynthesis [Ancylobacter tetraedralis]
MAQSDSPGGITAIILTFNEAKHIARCIDSLRPVAARICVIDSHSTDDTAEIARAHGAEVFLNPWRNYATQFQWGLDNAGITTGWTMRIDADEYLEPALQQAIGDFLARPGAVNAVYFRRKVVFLDRPITHGFFYPALMLRLWRSGAGRIEQRWMDEHILVENPVTATLPGDLVDHNLNDLAWWTGKHIGYARREAYDIIASRAAGESREKAGDLSGSARRKRFLKERIYNRLPSALRSSLYFFYRYGIGRGFLDGKEGFFFHFLQAYWYRTYVDASLLELERRAQAQGLTAHEMLKRDGILT